jgi:hypothetical protein
MATVQDNITIGDILASTYDTNPITGGSAAPIGSLGSGLDGTGLAYKWGAGNTDWYNIPMTDAQITAYLLTGYAVGANTPLAAGDSVLGAFGKVQGQINALSVAGGNYVLKAGDTMSGYLTLNADPVNALHAATKAYVDGFISGITYLNQIIDPNLKSDNLNAPPVAISDEVYIAGAAPTGAWAGLAGHAFYYNAGTGSWVDILGRAVIAGDRFGVLLENNTQIPGGGVAGKLNQIAQVNSPTPGSITYTFTVPALGNTVYATKAPLAPHNGDGYWFGGVNWTEFIHPSGYINGAGLTLTGNIFSIGTGQVTNSMLATAYVPYTGATSPVNLGSQNLSTTGNLKAGSLLNNAVATPVINLTLYGLYDNLGQDSVLFNTRVASDSAGIQSIDWQNRALKTALGATIIDWSGAVTYVTTATLTSGYVPYTGASADVNIATRLFIGSALKANSSGGGTLQSNSGTTALTWGAGGGSGITIAGGVIMAGGTASSIMTTDGSKLITYTSNLSVALGGTGFSTYNIGDLLQATGATTLSTLAAVATGNVLISGGILTASSWGKVGLTTHVSGVLATANGGTGLSTVGTAGQVLTIVAGVPAWAAPATNGTVTSITLAMGTTGLTGGSTITTSGTWTLGGTLVAANGGTGQNAYTTGDILIATGATALSKLQDVATGNALISGGVGLVPSYGKIGLTTHVSGTLPVANGGTNITSYTVGAILYASAAGVVNQLLDVAVGNVLRSGGVGVAPAYGKVVLTTDVSGILPVANGGTGVSVNATNNQKQPANPVGSASAVGLMQGLGVLITPTKTGNIIIVISGNVTVGSNNTGAAFQIRTGTGAAPANGAVISGTAQGTLNSVFMTNAGDVDSFAVNATVTALTIGTTYWIDLTLAVTGGALIAATLTNISVSIIEQ